MNKSFSLTILMIALSFFLEAQLMDGFPPKPNQQVTIENWLEAPFNQWGFQNVRRLTATAEIRKGKGPASVIEKDDKMQLSSEVEKMLDETNTDGFLVMHHGKIVIEKYFNTMTPHTLHILWSSSKSILGALAGILIEQGTLKPNMTASQYVPELKSSGYADATIRELLDMTVALDSSANDNFASFKNEKNWSSYHFVEQVKKNGKNGEIFLYSSPNAVVLGWIIERVTNMHLTDLMSQLIWSPLGTEMEANSIVDSIGTSQPSGGISASMRDLGRFGQMIVQKGKYNGQQIIPSTWIEDTQKNGNKEAFSKSDFEAFNPGGYYRNMWWVAKDGAFMAFGTYGQFLYIDFNAEVVIVKLSSQPNEADVEMAFHTLYGMQTIVQTLSKKI